jgi:hypothetical protein
VEGMTTTYDYVIVSYPNRQRRYGLLAPAILHIKNTKTAIDEDIKIEEDEKIKINDDWLWEEYI